jgi:hypothetical protein
MSGWLVGQFHGFPSSWKLEFCCCEGVRMVECWVFQSEENSGDVVVWGLAHGRLLIGRVVGLGRGRCEEVLVEIGIPLYIG